MRNPFKNPARNISHSIIIVTWLVSLSVYIFYQNRIRVISVHDTSNLTASILDSIFPADQTHPYTIAYEQENSSNNSESQNEVLKTDINHATNWIPDECKAFHDENFALNFDEIFSKQLGMKN